MRRQSSLGLLALLFAGCDGLVGLDGPGYLDGAADEVPAPSRDAGYGGNPADATTSSVTLAPSPAGWVSAPSVNITGGFYAFADSWGPNGTPPGICQSVGGFLTSQCSQITSPSYTLSSSGSSNFPPSSTGKMCISGTVAKVIDKSGTSVSDYTDIYGMGIGLDFNNPNHAVGAPTLASTKMPYNAVANNVVGFSFDVSGVPLGGIYVEFPTLETSAGFDAEAGGPPSGQDPYMLVVYRDGHYQANLTTDTKQAYHLREEVAPPAGMTEPPFDPTMLLAIDFRLQPSTENSVSISDLCVSNVTAILGGH
jgi:hypothetical protein